MLNVVEDVHRSAVVRDLSPKRVYSKMCLTQPISHDRVNIAYTCAAVQNIQQHRVQMPPLFCHPEHLHRPVLAQQVIDTAPGTAVRPKLLQRAEDVLNKKLEAAKNRAASFGPQQADWAASTLRTDAHRQVFEMLINSMTTYKPILMSIRRQYDAALDGALKATYTCNMIKADLAVAEKERAAAVDAALVQCAEDALLLRKQLLDLLAETDARTRTAEAAAIEAEAAASDAQQQLQHLQRKARELALDNRRLHANMRQRCVFTTPPP